MLTTSELALRRINKYLCIGNIKLELEVNEVFIYSKLSSFFSRKSVTQAKSLEEDRLEIYLSQMTDGLLVTNEQDVQRAFDWPTQYLTWICSIQGEARKQGRLHSLPLGQIA